MAIKDLLSSIDSEIKIIHDSDFEIEVIETNYVPNFDDSNLTFENFDTKKKKVKTIETCVLYIDIRKSTALNLQHHPYTMAKLYSSFVRSMIKAAEYHNGKVRNIIGDRVMVVYDTNNCYTNAVNTAILMNTISQSIINKRFKNNVFTCGIGIDYGKMMVTKCGTIKQGSENSNYKSLVWLGKPANIASKLTDNANKPSNYTKESGFLAGFHFPSLGNEWSWYFKTNEELVNEIEFKYTTPEMRYKNNYFKSFFATTRNKTKNDSTPPILVSESVYNGFKKENPQAPSIKNNWWSLQTRNIPDYSGKTYGCDISNTWQ